MGKDSWYGMVKAVGLKASRIGAVKVELWCCVMVFGTVFGVVSSSVLYSINRIEKKMSTTCPAVTCAVCPDTRTDLIVAMYCREFPRACKWKK